MLVKRLILAAAVLLVAAGTSNAATRHQHHHYRHHYAHHHVQHVKHYAKRHAKPHVQTAAVADTAPAENVRPAPCYGIPWCGCWLRIKLGIDDTRYNLAAFWHNFGTRISEPVVGAIARFNHHVGIVVAVDPNGNPVVKSGNHHHAVGIAVYPKRSVIEYRVATM